MRLNIKLKAAVAGLVLAGSAVLGISTSVMAAPVYEVEYTYYDDNGAYVGSILYTCNGGTISSGKVTSNYDIILVPCESEF